MQKRLILTILGLVWGSVLASGQSTTVSDPQATTLASQSRAALLHGNTISDVSLVGSVTWSAGSDSETGNATLVASGTGESRIDLVLSSGTRSEIRDAQTGIALGKWMAPDGSSGQFAFHNCQTDAVWFFPALGSLASGPNVVLSYIGQETRNGSSVQHIQSYIYQSGSGAMQQQLSTMDFYLDATTFLPSVVTFNAHPDNDAATNLLTEVDLSNYQTISGATVPTHIQRFQQGNLMLDVSVAGTLLNSGLSLSNFSIN